MNRKQKIQLFAYSAIAGFVVMSILTNTRSVRDEERGKRKEILNDMGLDVAAIHRATDVVNGRIERGEIRSYDQLREAVTTEVAFQKISIREDMD